MNMEELLQIALHAAEEAGREILTVYHSGDFQVELKGDASPLTWADKKSDEAIQSILKSTGIPILSEEGKNIPYSVRKQWEYFWLVDPLDGTKEFLKRNGEFTVNIALVHHQTPVLGVVTVPATGDIYYGVRGMGAFRKQSGVAMRLSVRKPATLEDPGLRVIASRSHMDPDTEQFVARLKHPVIFSAGSSLKFMRLATGEADVYPRFAPTMEWDTAAAHAIVKEVGLSVRAQDGTELMYNKESLLNPFFLCFSGF